MLDAERPPYSGRHQPAVSATQSKAGWEIEVGGLCFELGQQPLVLGRDPECEIPLQDPRVSWRHAKLELVDSVPVVTDLGSSNGTYLDRRKVGDGPTPIKQESILRLGDTRMRVRELERADDAGQRRFRRVPVRRRPIRIGRAPDNEVVLDEPNVSWHHAELRPGAPPTLVDLGSRNGIRLGNQLLQGAASFGPGMPAGIGPFSLRFENGEIVVVDERGALDLVARQVTVDAGGRRILQPTSLAVATGELVALIGASGSGKTTLLKCMAGVAQPTGGHVLVGVDPLELRLTDVGYVPQSEVVHERLTVREALLYSAKLRLPSDTRHDERAIGVDGVLEELQLSDHAGTFVGRLSGGQRKRVACGLELIGKPTMLLLDEPTSGLDPPLERRLMQTFRKLADCGRGVVVATHATSSLSFCDTVAVMAPGGFLLFAGSPREALERFQVSAYDEIYNQIDLASIPVSATQPPPPAPRRQHRRLLAGRSLLKQTAALSARYARTLWRDRRTLAVLLGQAPVIAALIGLLYPSGALRLPDHHPDQSSQFIFLLVTAALWLGLIDSCREIVKERSIILRELAAGVRLDAYLLAKAGLLFVLAAIQCALLLGVAAVIQPLHAGPAGFLGLLGLLVLTSWSSVALGLAVSTLARSVDQATSFIPLLLIPQLLFGGALVAFAQMAAPLKALADLMVARWAFAGGGHAIHMNLRLATAPKVRAITGYGPSFFSLDQGLAAIVLAGFTAALLLAAAGLLARRSSATS